MSYYAIGIGGTGAKCLESLIHLAAAGLMPDRNKLHVLFVDPDTSNGSRARVEETYSHYVACKDNLDFGQTDLLKTQIVPDAPKLWTPFDKGNPRLEQFFRYANFKGSPAGNLFDVLYSKAEKESPLEEGFRGHPSIGSAVMAKTVDVKKDKTLNSFFGGIPGDGEKAKVFLAGSIFGGTGASGFPTIAQIIKNALPVKKLGGALILPYFKFDDKDDGKLEAKSAEFLMNTQTALKYYHHWEQTDIYDAVYLFGDESRTKVEKALGGQKQKNVPHFIELYAALAAIDFFGKDDKDDKDGPYFLTAREQSDHLKWTDLPDGGEVRSKIGQLARFAVAYLSVYHPTLQGIAGHGKKAYRAPWFVDFFERGKDSAKDATLKDIKKYCKDFLLWLANVQDNCGAEETIELINYGVYAKRKKDGSFNFDFSTDLRPLIQSQLDTESNVLHKIWERMCNSRSKGRGAQGIGEFLRALYENCGE